MRKLAHILFFALLLTACSGTRKYFKAAERLEKQGLVNDAAEYYLESLQRKPTSAQARIKLKEVGQKHISNLSSEFFRNFNTQQTEAALESFEKLKDFSARSNALDVQFDYPKTYDDDYQKAIETFCLKNYNQAAVLVNQKNYSQALTYITLIKKYNTAYKNTPQLEVVSVCEPLYQTAINNLENKNYSAALTSLSGIKARTENYKDCKDLLELATAQQTKSFILFQPQPTGAAGEKEVRDYLFNNFMQTALQKLTYARVINNTPFQNAPGSIDLNSSNNVDLIQAIRKATGTDYFYVYDVDNRRDFNQTPAKTPGQGFEEITTRTGSVVITQYAAFNYNLVKAQRSFSFDFKYKIINAYSNQIVAQQTQNMVSQDAVEYQEFVKSFNGNINTLYPFNPQQTPPTVQLQYNTRNWRGLFSARNSLKTMEELKNDAYTKTLNAFVSSAANMK